MIFAQRRLQREAWASHIRVLNHQAEINRQTAAQLARAREIAARPSSLALAFAAGFVIERMRPGWDVLSSLAGLGLSLSQRDSTLSHLIHLFLPDENSVSE